MINEYKYGMFKVDGKTHCEDIKIIGSRVRYWECRTREINPEHVKDLVAINPEVMVIGLGAGGLISVSDSVKDLLHDKKIQLIAEKNPSAIEKYNQALLAGKKVAALLPARG